MTVEAHGRSRLRVRVGDSERDVVRPVARETVSPVEAHGRTRKRKGNADPFFIPPELIPEGWNYQWCRKSVHGQEDTAHLVAMAENGWTPVPSDRHAGYFMPKGHQGDIERGGLLLMERPIELTREARMEEKAAAEGLVQAQREQLGLSMPAGFNNEHPGVRPSIKTTYEPGPAQGRHALAID